MLNPETKESEGQHPTAWQVFDHNREMYQIELEDSGELLVSPEHRVYGLVNYKNSESSWRSLTTLPSSSSGECCFNNLEIACFCDSKSLGRILNSQIPRCLEEMKRLSRKSASLVISNLCSLNANLKTSPFEMVLGVNLTSCPNSDRNEDSPLCTFSSNKNLILGWNRNHEISFSDLSSKVQGCPDVVLSQGRVCFKDFLGGGFIFKHFENYGNHDPSAFESRLSMADFTVNNNILINFNSHILTSDKEVYKSFSSDFKIPFRNFSCFKEKFSCFKLRKITDIYTSVNTDGGIYFLGKEKNPVQVRKIEKVPYSGKIYDVDVPNDIILVRKKGKAIWSGNSNSKAVDISKYGNNRTFHNSPNVSWTKDAFNLGVEGEATGEDIPSTKNEYWTINIPETGVKGNCNNTIIITAVVG